MQKSELKEKFSSCVIAIENFGDNRELGVNDFDDKLKLFFQLKQLNDHEISLTEEGVIFLEEYYGIKEIASLLLERINKGYDYKYKNKNDIITWIRGKGDFISGD